MPHAVLQWLAPHRVIPILYSSTYHERQTIVLPYRGKPTPLWPMLHTASHNLQCPGPYGCQSCRFLHAGLVYVDMDRACAMFPGSGDFKSCIGAPREDYGSGEVSVAIQLVYGHIAVIHPNPVKVVQRLETLNHVAGKEPCRMGRIRS